MGGSKAKTKPQKKARPTVPTKFDCLFCNHAQTVECKLNYNNQIGTIKCRVCDASYQTSITHLTDPIDVYSEWIDETEKVNTADANGQYAQQQQTDAVDDSDAVNDNTQQRIASRRNERAGNAGYAKDDGFIASEDDDADELGIEDD